MTLLEGPAAVVQECAEQVRPIAGVVALYAGGSLLTEAISRLDRFAVPPELAPDRPPRISGPAP